MAAEVANFRLQFLLTENWNGFSTGLNVIILLIFHFLLPYLFNWTVRLQVQLTIVGDDIKLLVVEFLALFAVPNIIRRLIVSVLQTWALRLRIGVTENRNEFYIGMKLDILNAITAHLLLTWPFNWTVRPQVRMWFDPVCIEDIIARLIAFASPDLIRWFITAMFDHDRVMVGFPYLVLGLIVLLAMGLLMWYHVIPGGDQLGRVILHARDQVLRDLANLIFTELSRVAWQAFRANVLR